MRVVNQVCSPRLSSCWSKSVSRTDTTVFVYLLSRLDYLDGTLALRGHCHAVCDQLYAAGPRLNWQVDACFLYHVFVWKSVRGAPGGASLFPHEGGFVTGVFSASGNFGMLLST